ncbi:hypothetical protein [Luteitalea sp.]|uniref:hypothetical protein n=1 Tax=Luteitalea sp. TaxID=2004800 RepID=UPI0037CB188A
MTRRGMLTGGLVWALAMVGTAGAASAQQVQVTRPRAGKVGQWRLLGSVEAGFTADHDTIVVSGVNDWFRRIKFKVTDAGLNLQRLVVTYESGQPDRIDVRQDIPKGGESRQIDLAGAGQRRIRRIEFWYDTKGVLSGRANVSVFGLK